MIPNRRHAILWLAVPFGVVVWSLAGCGDGAAGGGSAPAGAGQNAAAPSTRPEPVAPGKGGWKDAAKNSIDLAVRYLRDHQSADGKWSFNAKSPPDLGITSLCLLGMMDSPRAYREDDGPFIRQGIAWIAASQKPDGSIHGGMLATYNTATAMLALARTGNAKYRPILDKALEYLRVVQSDESERYQQSDRYYGGVGYGGDERPDLSNTHFAVEAAQAAGMDPNDPFFKKALVFASRCQNLSESNDLKDAEVAVGNDGGGVYSPGVTAGEAKAGFVTLPDGKKVRRSYGSMSYCLLKTYLFCNLDRKDPRVRGLADWLSKNYRVDYNPGMEAGDKPEARFAGLFYYYVAMARALPVAGDDLIRDDAGKPRAWRKDLAEAIVAMQGADGAFANDKNAAFWENSPIVATAMAVLALDACVK